MQRFFVFTTLVVMCFLGYLGYKFGTRIEALEKKDEVSMEKAAEKAVDKGFRAVAEKLKAGTTIAATTVAEKVVAPQQETQAESVQLSGIDEFAQAICRMHDSWNCRNPPQVSDLPSIQGPSLGIVTQTVRKVLTSPESGQPDMELVRRAKDAVATINELESALRELKCWKDSGTK